MACVCLLFAFRILRTAGAIGQIGWARHGFAPRARHGEGVGDDQCSWGFDGERVQKWGGEGGSDWGESWREGDVIGIAADLDRGEVWFGRNGNWGAPMGCAFRGVSSDSGLFPALSGGRGLRLQVNRGQDPWAYGLPAHLATSTSPRLPPPVPPYRNPEERAVLERRLTPPRRAVSPRRAPTPPRRARSVSPSSTRRQELERRLAQVREMSEPYEGMAP